MTPSCVVWSTQWKGCHPGEPWQAWEMGLCKSQEFQQGQVQGPACRSGQSQAQIQAGQRMDWEQSWGEGLGGADWQEAEHDLAMCAHSPEGQLYPGLHQKRRGQQVEGDDSAPLWWEPTWSPASNSGALSTGKTWMCWSGYRGGPQKIIQGVKHCSKRKGWESSA